MKLKRKSTPGVAVKITILVNVGLDVVMTDRAMWSANA